MKIDRALYDELVAHALADKPDECCGMVAAADGVATRVFPAVNIHASPLRYEIDPADLLRVFTEIEDGGWTLGAIYHSHTRSAPRPSQTDINLAYMADGTTSRWPGTLYVIVGVAEVEPDVRAYRIEAGAVEEVALSVV
jgi:proteasome lid subunit RPN8/RPN11